MSIFKPAASLLVVISFLFGPNDAVLRAEAVIKPERVREIAAMLPAKPRGLGEPVSNRAAWGKLAENGDVKNWVAGVRTQMLQAFPEAPDELYLDFSRTGNRDRYQNVIFTRRDRMANFAIAECIENKGEFLPALESAIQQICAERTWIYPAHDRTLRNFNGPDVDIDLGSSRIGWELATIDYVLGDKLSKPVRSLIQSNLHDRIFAPYREMAEGRVKENSWLRATHNWNSVCHAGVVGTALAGLSSAEERAWFIAAAEYYIPNFLSGFGRDGYCSEGMGYWNYGFGHYIMLAETVRQATNGKLDFFSDPAARLPALFGERAEIINGIYPSIADCHPDSRPDPLLVNYICRRFQLGNCGEPPPAMAVASRGVFGTMLFAFLPKDLPRTGTAAQPESKLRTWFSDGGVLLCRPEAGSSAPFAVSLKGGHNAEHHNHNDLGSFIVVAGNSPVLVDPGSEVYTERTFGSRRYESDVLNSFGHPVPVIAGKLQSKGAKARAVVLETKFTDASDTLVLDLTSAYAVPTLQSLKRSFVYQRGNNPSLTITDTVAFTAAETYETALVTWGEWKQLSDVEFHFKEATGAVRVKVAASAVPFEVISKQLEADVRTPKKAKRIGLRLKKPVAAATITMIITPEP